MQDMYDSVSGVIEAGGYDLADLLHRIDVLYARGSLTEDESAELIDKARDEADPSGAYAPLADRVTELELWECSAQKDISDALSSISSLDARVAALESGEPKPEPEPEPEPEDAYPAWHQPTGAHDAYYTDDKMTYTDGKRYVCTAPEGYGVTYGPDVLPDMWELVG